MQLLRIRPAILLFGDSITQFGFGVDGKVGWAGLLAAAYTRRADVLSRGFSGYNTNHAIDLVPRVFGAPHEDGILFCTIFFGANDAALPESPQHVPIDQYQDNLKRIVDMIRERTSTTNKTFPIIFITPPPVHEFSWASYQGLEFSDRKNDVTRAYGDRMKKVASQCNSCSVVDSWDLLLGHSDDRQRFLSDGLHLSEDGNRQIFQGLMDVIHANYPNLAPLENEDGKSIVGAQGLRVEEKLWKELVGLEECQAD